MSKSRLLTYEVVNVEIKIVFNYEAVFIRSAISNGSQGLKISLEDDRMNYL